MGRAFSPYFWSWNLAHNLVVACSLRLANCNGWWDGAGYHRDEVVLTRRWKKPENKGPAFTSGSPTAGALDIRMAA